MAKPFRNFSGMRIGQYVVIRRVGVTKTGAGLWKCKCSCGKIFELSSGTIGSGIQKSCGCLRRGNKTGQALKHGYTSNGVISAEAKAYYGARNRCLSPSNHGYKDYGGRGIEFRFASLVEMIEEVGKKPNGRYGLGRKDPNGHYEKGNVEWQTPKELAAKRQRPERLEVGGFKIDGSPCRLIELTLGQWMIVDAEDYERMASIPWYAVKNNKSNKHYAVNAEHGTAHRFLLGPENGLHVDHDNGNTLDNRKINLRPATKTDNNRNVGKTVRNTSGLKGASFYRGMFRSSITINDKKKWLGEYVKKEEAHLAWCYAAVFYYGKFANCGCSPSCIGRQE